MPSSLPSDPTAWRRLSDTAVRLFRNYANWLVGITWKRFIALSVLLMILAGILQHVPPFRWSWTEETDDARPARAPAPPAPPSSGQRRATNGREPRKSDDKESVTISISGEGVTIEPRGFADSAATASSGAAAAASAPAQSASRPAGDNDTLEIPMPGASRETIREAARAAREAAREAADDVRRQAAEAVEDARRDADEARQEAADAVREARHSQRTRVVHLGDSLPELAFLWIVFSAILKAVYKGRVRAEVQAAAATETAESEQLKRQVVEARMAAMQAQVEPHFLFNTLASIDHLIETDPPRASQMQKNLIALLRASMPAMRENHPAAHSLGREMAVVRPYLAILKVRMEDRLQPAIDVPDGLLSADFPPMMLQSLVENAIKHGLEPKPEGGTLTVKAEIVHGRLAVSVADTGLGFGKAATAGTGIGLANIRERLQLLYGGRGSMTISENLPSGTVVTLTVPYQALADAAPGSV